MTEYIHRAEWYEKDTPKCPDCGEPMNSMWASPTHRDKPREYWTCTICGYEELKVTSKCRG